MRCIYCRTRLHHVLVRVRHRMQFSEHIWPHRCKPHTFILLSTIPWSASTLIFAGHEKAQEVITTSRRKVKSAPAKFFHPSRGRKGSTRSFGLLCTQGCRDSAQSAQFDNLAPALKFPHDARELSSKRIQQRLLQPTDGPPRTSHSLQHHVVRLVCRILNCCQNVVPFKIGIVLQNLLVRRPGAEKLQNVCDANPHATNARTPAAFPRLYRDSFQKVGFHRNCTLPLKEAPDKPATRLSHQAADPWWGA